MKEGIKKEKIKKIKGSHHHHHDKNHPEALSISSKNVQSNNKRVWKSPNSFCSTSIFA